MNESNELQKKAIKPNRALMSVLAGSVALSFFALFSIAYYYGAVQSTCDVLITPKNYPQATLSEKDALTGKSMTYFVGNILLIDYRDQETPKTIEIHETAYRKIFETLQEDHLAIAKRSSTGDQPLMSLVLQLKADTQTPLTKPLILQQVDFYGDDQPYRVTGRLDKKTAGEEWYFVHKNVCKEVTQLLQLIQ